MLWLSIAVLLIWTGLADANDRILVDAALNDSTHSISGSVRVTWQRPDTSWRDLHFRLWGAVPCSHATQIGNQSKSACGTTVDSVVVNGSNLADSMAIEETDLRVSLSSVANDSLVAVIYFSTYLPHSFDRLCYVDGTYFLDGWFPMPAPFRNGRWQVITYTQEAELVADFYDIDVVFRSDTGLQQIAPGLVRADTVEGFVTNYYQLHPSHDFAMVIGSGYKMKVFHFGQSMVSIYHKEHDEVHIDSIASAIQTTFDFMASHVHPYPFDELAVVVGIKFGGGIEFPRMYWQTSPDRSDMTKFDKLVAIHETLHQWFYGILASNQAENPWMDEAITEYMTHRVFEADTIKESYIVKGLGFSAQPVTYDRLQGYSMFDRLPMTRSAAGYPSFEGYSAAVYGKGSLVIGTFGALLGSEEDRFWKSYYEQFAFKTPADSDFIALANQFAPFSENRNAQEVLDWNRRLDYCITDISAFKDSNQYRSEISYGMMNAMPFAVTIRYTLGDGTQTDTSLSGRIGDGKLTILNELPVIAAEIDPDRQYEIDMNYLNNAFVTKGNGAAFRIFSAMTFLVESLYSLLWGW